MQRRLLQPACTKLRRGRLPPQVTKAKRREMRVGEVKREDVPGYKKMLVKLDPAGVAERVSAKIIRKLTRAGRWAAKTNPVCVFRQTPASGEPFVIARFAAPLPARRTCITSV